MRKNNNTSFPYLLNFIRILLNLLLEIDDFEKSYTVQFEMVLGILLAFQSLQEVN